VPITDSYLEGFVKDFYKTGYLLVFLLWRNLASLNSHMRIYQNLISKIKRKTPNLGKYQTGVEVMININSAEKQEGADVPKNQIVEG